MDHPWFGFLLFAIGFLTGGLVLDYAGQVVALVAASAGIGALVARYYAILLGYRLRDVRIATALGFFGGLVFSAVVIVVDLIVEAYS